jgi:hypothetical protein
VQAASVKMLVLILIFSAIDCTSRRRATDAANTRTVVIDLRHMAPIGYEFCKPDPPKLPRRNLQLTVQLPKRLELPPDAYMGVKEIDFRPGAHTVDLYRHLNSGRLFSINGTITSVKGVPTLKVKLKMGELPSGRYVVGISGDPYFGYCTIDFE